MAGFITVSLATKSKGIPTATPTALLTTPTLSQPNLTSIHNTSNHKNNLNTNTQKNNDSHKLTLSNLTSQQQSCSKLVNVEFTCVCYQSHLRMKLQSDNGRRDIIQNLTDRDLYFNTLVDTY